MKTFLAALGISLVPFLCSAFHSSKADSLITSGRTVSSVITHRVSHGETLYSLLRKYQCTREKFDTLNPTMKGTNTIKIDQKLKFPSDQPATPVTESLPKVAKTEIQPESTIQTAETPQAETGKTKTATTIHTVVANETLYSISKRYDADIDEIRRINHLIGNEISIGQTLMIRRSSEEMETTYHIPNITPENQPGKIVIPDGKLAEKVEESGIAELIQSNKKGDQMLALHKTAPLGSLILVKNKATGRQVTAKVIGKLPDTGNNENVLIRLSPAAFYKLNPKDIRISAEVTYYLPPSPM